jgi:hypothetical protein
LIIHRLPRGQLPLDLSTVYARLAEQAVAREVEQMQVLLYSQGDGPVWPGNVRRRNRYAAVITVWRAVRIRSHGSSFPRRFRNWSHDG